MNGRLLRRGLLKQSVHTGKGYFSGEGEGIVTVNGEPASRRILLLDCATLRFVRGTWSNQDGTYRLSHLDPNRQYLMLARDHLGEWEPVAYDLLRPKVDA